MFIPTKKQLHVKSVTYLKTGFKFFIKELGPRTANILISLKMKMIDKVLKSDYSANETLLILCLFSNRFLHYDVIKSVIITEIKPL